MGRLCNPVLWQGLESFAWRIKDRDHLFIKRYKTKTSRRTKNNTDFGVIVLMDIHSQDVLQKSQRKCDSLSYRISLEIIIWETSGKATACKASKLGLEIGAGGRPAYI